MVFKNNVESTYHVLEECARAKVKRFCIPCDNDQQEKGNPNTMETHRFVFASTNHTQNGSMITDPARPRTNTILSVARRVTDKVVWPCRDSGYAECEGRHGAPRGE